MTADDSQARANVPRHVAIIMDGNGRWARRRGMPRQFGHRAGVKPVREAVRFAAEQGVDVLTLFAFSSENWRRPKEEVGALMTLFLEALDREVAELHQNDVRLTFVGAIERLSTTLQQRMAAAQTLTGGNGGLRLNVAVAYGGRWDILSAVRRAIAAGVGPDELDESRFASFLVLADCPEPDLLIRTGGEQRISNFLLWQLAYSELFFTDTLWPDFNRSTFAEALEAYASRQRRRGRTGEQLRSAEC